MRPGLLPDSALDRLAIRLNLAPVAAGHAMFGMPMARVTIAGQQLGIFARLSRGAATADEVARDLGLEPSGAMLLLDSLAALEHVDNRGGKYSLSKSARKWLDPGSEDYVGTYIEHCLDYWSWWDRLEDIVRSGHGIEIHDFPPDHPHNAERDVRQWLEETGFERIRRVGIRRLPGQALFEARKPA